MWRRWQERIGSGVLIFDYPGYGRSSGRPSEAGCYAAADACYDWLVKEKAVAPHDILLHGGSLGGAVAVELAGDAVLRSGDPGHVHLGAGHGQALYPWLPARPFIRNRFETLAKIGSTVGCVFLAHGTADRFIPFGMAERLFAAAPEPKRLFPLVGYGHNHAPGPEFYAALSQFLQETDVRHESVRPGGDPS